MPQKKPELALKQPKLSKPIKPDELYIIAIGASAGGLEALQEFLAHLPTIKNACVIVAQHLSPTHKSMLVQLLSRETKLQVAEAENGATLEANKIYITPPDKEISISSGRIILKKPQSSVGPKPSVDVLFHSLAEGAAHRVLGIILSGTGSDGASGVRTLKKNGGFIIAQEPHTAKYDGMPLAAIETGEVDLVLPPEKMGEEIREYFLNPGLIRIKQSESENTGSSIEKVIKILSKRTGTDFSNYKSATIIRRLEKRLAILKIKSIDEYLKLLEKNPKEQDEMFNMILIGVTNFFRDIEAFGALENILHKIINAKTNNDNIRIWVPGCYTGEEAYSIAILCSRILKERTQNFNIQIFATDIDEKAIATARKGIYPEASLENVPKEIIENYFVVTGKQYELVKSVRSMVLFSKHDVTNNPPFLKLDLISCRNLLIYFSAGLQQQIIPIFHYALLQDSYLFLGKSETVGQYSDLFATTDGKNKIFQRKRGGNLHSIKFSAFKAQKQTLPQQSVKKIKKDLSISDLVKETIFNTYEHPYVVINQDFDILEINGDVRLFMSLPQGSIQVNLLKMVNTELQIEIRSIITKAIKGRESVRSSIKKFELFGNFYHVRITTKPLIFTEQDAELFIVIFERLDLEEFIAKGIVTNDKELVDVRLNELEHELAATKEHLQTYIEELETSNEEMQSLNEEMQSTNEELQSSNEELETSNEELQSTNEEIQITYAELKAANEELERKEKLLKDNEANINALLNNKLQGFILIDPTYKLVTFNEKASEVFLTLRNKKLNSNESFIDLVDPVQLESFVSDFARVLAGKNIHKEILLRDYNRQERWYSLNLTGVSTADQKINGISIGLLDITDLKKALSQIDDKDRMIASVFNATSIGICVTNDKGIFVDVNDAYCAIYGYKKEELVGKNFCMMVPPEYSKVTQQLHDDFILSGEEPPSEWEVLKKDGTTIQIFVTASLLETEDGNRLKITSVRDISYQKTADKIIKASEEKYKAIINTSINAIFLAKPTGQISQANQAACDLFGYNEEELKKIGRQGIIDESDKSFKQGQKERAQKGNSRGELRGIKKDGTVFDLEFSSSIFQDANGETFSFSMMNDISERKEMHQQLETNEKRFRAMVENGSDAIVILDANINPTYMSPGAHRIVGYSEAEAFQLDTFSSIHPDDGDYIKARLQESFSKPGVPIKNLSYRIKHKDGRWLWVEATITNLLHDPAIAGIVTNFSDVTEIKKIETQLGTITDNLNGVVFRYKLNEDGTDEMMYLSKGSIDLWGVQAENAMQNNALIWNLFHPDDLPAVINSIQLSKENLQEWTTEWRIHHPDGSTRWQRGVGNPQRLPDGSTIWDSIIVDITNIKEQELELTRIKLNQESLINGTADLIWSVDTNLRIITANEAYLQTMSFATQKTIKEGDPVIVEEFGEEMVAKWKEYYQRALKGEKYNIEEKVYNPSKQVFEHGLVSFNPMHNPSGAVFGVACYSKDITELVNKQQEVINTKAELDKIMDYSPDVVCTINEAGEFVKLSAASENIWGYTPEELIGKKYMDFVHPDDHEKTILAATAITSGKDMTNFENRYIRKNGRIVHIIWSARWDDKEKLMFCIAKDGTEKNIAETALIESEKKYKDLFENNPSPMFIWEFATRQIIDCNVEALLQYGYSREEFLQLSIIDIRPKEDIARLEKSTDSEESYGNIHNKTWRHLKKNGELFFVEVNGHLINYNGVKASLVMVTDITEKIKAEEELKQSEAFLAEAQRLAKLGSWNFDFRNDKLTWSNELYEVFGTDKETFKETHGTFVNLVDEEDQAFVQETSKRAQELGEPFNIEYRITTPAGERRIIEEVGNVEKDEQGKIVRLYGTAQDITERKTAEVKIKESNQRYENVTKATYDAIWDWDLVSNHIYRAEGFKTSFGFDIETLNSPGLDWNEFVHPEDRPVATQSIKAALQGTDNYWKHEYRLIRPDGQIVFVQDRAFIVRDDKQKALRIIGALKDITESKYYHDLETLEREILELNALGNLPVEAVIGKYMLGIEKLHPGMLCSMQERRGNQLFNMSSPHLPAAYIEAISGISIGNNVGSCGTAAFSKKRVIVSDIQNDERWGNFNYIANEYGLKACWSSPILDTNGEVIATFASYFKEVKEPTFFEENSIDRAGHILQVILEGYQREKAIQESNLRYENVTRATSDAIWDWNLETNELYWGMGFQTLFGHTIEKNKSNLNEWNAHVHPKDLQAVTESLNNFIKDTNQENWQKEYQYRRADGSYAIVLDKGVIIRDEQGKGIRMYGAMQDITKQKEEEQRLKLLSSVITNTNDAILITEAEPFDLPGPRILYANDAFYKMTGFSMAETIGNSPRMLQGPLSDKVELNRLSKAIRNWQPCEITTINYKKNGEPFWVNFALSPVTDEKGWFTHWISIQRDVTQQKNAEIQKTLLNQITRIFNEPDNLVTALEKVLHQVTSFGGFSFADTWLVAADGKTINKIAACAETEAMQVFLSESAHIKSLKKGEGIIGIAWETKTIQHWTDVDERKDFVRHKAAKIAGLKNAVALPLYHNFEVIGVLMIGVEQREKSLFDFESLIGDLGNYMGAEIKRKQLERELHQLFSFAPDIIAIAGMDGYFKKVNPATIQLLEYSEMELLSTPFIDFIHPEDKHKSAIEINSLVSGLPTLYNENRYVTKSGKIKWLAWTSTPFPQESIMFAVAKDITERKELEELLQKANEMARIGGWEVDLLKGTIFWSAMTKEIHEVGVDFVPEMDTAINFYKAGENREKITALLQVAMENGQPWDEELQITTGKGNERWIRAIGDVEIVNGKCIRIFGSFQDIDERKKSALAVTQTLEEKNNILESIGDAFFAVDTNWTVTYWNQVAEKVMGMSREDIVGKYLWDLYQDAIDTDFYKFYHLAVNENKVQQFEARYEALNLWVEVSAYPSPNGLSIYFKDITERKTSEIKLQELNENLQKQTKELEVSNRELEQFAFVASHDLQEPLRMVSSFLTQLSRKYDHMLDDKARKYIGFATDGAARMRELILDLLEFSRIGRMHENPEKVDLNELVEAITVLHSNQIIETNATITCSQLPSLHFYKTPLRQVFQNLISNALKYSRTGVATTIKINAVDKKTYWLFSVSDNGIGINDEYFDKIFIIFQRLHNKDQYSGTGMGLSVTKKIIESFNGKIWLESTEGEGSTFYFTIPKN